MSMVSMYMYMVSVCSMVSMCMFSRGCSSISMSSSRCDGTLCVVVAVVLVVACLVALAG